MRHFDFSPLYRATVGFDQIADLIDRVSSADSSNTTYPPYNIEKQMMTPIAFQLLSQDFLKTI